MKTFHVKLMRLLLLFAFLCLPAAANACSTCFGETGSPMARGLGVGVLVLFGTVLAVLSGIVIFAVYLAKRAARINAEEQELGVDERDNPYGLFDRQPDLGK